MKILSFSLIYFTFLKEDNSAVNRRSMTLGFSCQRQHLVVVQIYLSACQYSPNNYFAISLNIRMNNRYSNITIIIIINFSDLQKYTSSLEVYIFGE